MKRRKSLRLTKMCPPSEFLPSRSATACEVPATSTQLPPESLLRDALRHAALLRSISRQSPFRSVLAPSSRWVLCRLDVILLRLRGELEVLESVGEAPEVPVAHEEFGPIGVLAVADTYSFRERGKLYALASGRSRAGGLSPDDLVCFHDLALLWISSNDCATGSASP